MPLHLILNVGYFNDELLEDWKNENVLLIIILLGSLVTAGVLAHKFGRNEGSDLAARTSIENSKYQGFGFAFSFGLIVLSFVLGVVLIPVLDINGIMRTSLATMTIPFLMSGAVFGFINGREEGFNDVMHEKIKAHKALLKVEKKRVRGEKIRKIFRFWE